MDDSRIVLEAAAAWLKDFGFAVRTAGDVRELDRQLEQGELDLIVFDVQMPEAFGSDLGGVLRKVRKITIPILLFSSLDDAVLAKLVKDADLDGYVSKNAGVQALVSRIAQLLGAG
jgi:DNA-binding response OmpR family regulator